VRVSARSVAALGAVGLALANVGRIPAGALGGRTAPVVLADVAVVVVWLVLILAIASRAVPIVVDDIIGATGAFVLVAAVSTTLAFSRYHLGAADGAGVLGFLLRWIAYFGWYLLVVWCLTPNESRDAWRYIERAMVAIALFGILQSAFLPGFAQSLQTGSELPSWDIQGRRLVSTLLDPNFAGIVVVIALLFRLARIVEGVQESVLLLLALGAAVLLTVSRSAILALGVGVGVLAIARGLRARLVRVLLVGAILVLPFLSLLLAFASSFNKLRYDTSAAQRLVPWTRAVRLVIEHPLFGVGFNAIKPAQAAHGWRAVGGATVSFDGGLLFVAAMTGLVGLFFYVRLLGRVLRSARRAWRFADLPATDRAHATATAAATIAVVVHSLFVNSLLLAFVMQILWVMWGRLAHISVERRRRSRAAAVTIAAAALVAAGCDPCAGTIGCSVSPRVSMTGQIVDYVTGKSVPGTHIHVMITGSDGYSTQLSAVTRDDGLWEVHTGAPLDQTLQAQVTVSPPGLLPYTTPAFSVRASTRAGDQTVLGDWSDIPFVRYIATVLLGSSSVPGATIQFTRTAGVQPTSAQTDASANGAGIFELDMTAGSVGDVVGVLTVTPPGSANPVVLQNWAIPIGYRFGVPTPSALVPIG
jgi:O-antigen ligase